MFAWLKRIFGPRPFQWGQPYVGPTPCATAVTERRAF